MNKTALICGGVMIMLGVAIAGLGVQMVGEGDHTAAWGTFFPGGILAVMGGLVFAIGRSGGV